MLSFFLILSLSSESRLSSFTSLSQSISGSLVNEPLNFLPAFSASASIESVYFVPAYAFSIKTLCIILFNNSVYLCPRSDAINSREVAVLREGEEEAGPHVVMWDGRGARGRELAAGVYFVRIDFGGRKEAQKIVITH